MCESGRAEVQESPGARKWLLCVLQQAGHRNLSPGDEDSHYKEMEEVLCPSRGREGRICQTSEVRKLEVWPPSPRIESRTRVTRWVREGFAMWQPVKDNQGSRVGVCKVWEETAWHSRELRLPVGHSSICDGQAPPNLASWMPLCHPTGQPLGGSEAGLGVRESSGLSEHLAPSPWPIPSDPTELHSSCKSFVRVEISSCMDLGYLRISMCGTMSSPRPFPWPRGHWRWE
jgi:hypothetical protein